MEFTVIGQPQGKARARTFLDKRTGRMTSVTPQKTKDYENLIKWSYKAAKGQSFGAGAIRVGINAFYEIPKSFTKTKRTAAILGELRPMVKPDGDNIIKAVLDALNGVAYNDDKQVVCVFCEKFYSEAGGFLRILIEEITK